MKIAKLRELIKGKTHYFDPGTMSFFGSRLSEIEQLTDHHIIARESLRSGFDMRSPRVCRGLVVSLKTGNVMKVCWSDYHEAAALLVNYHRAASTSTKRRLAMKLLDLGNRFVQAEKTMVKP